MEICTISSWPIESPIEKGISENTLPAETLCKPLIRISSITQDEENKKVGNNKINKKNIFFKTFFIYKTPESLEISFIKTKTIKKRTIESPTL